MFERGYKKIECVITFNTSLARMPPTDTFQGQHNRLTRATQDAPTLS